MRLEQYNPSSEITVLAVCFTMLVLLVVSFKVRMKTFRIFRKGFQIRAAKYVKLHSEVLSRLAPGKMTYVFLDEVQHVDGYEKVVDSLYARDGIDIYITGSTADLLS